MDFERAAGSGAETGETQQCRGRPGAAARRLFALVLLAGLTAFAAGFLLFADQVVDARSPEEPHADGIVALTGGEQRIEHAARLLGRGSGQRLLISGVNENTSAGELAERSPQLARALQCCVDIGREALDTHGNAVETREWALTRGYDSLIVVTSAYHMPRSLAEIGRELPEVQLVPYPINPDGYDYAGWGRDPEVFRLLLVEYVKYVLARFA